MLLKSLGRLGLNFMNVFESLPRSIKSLYVHALQSYIWNKVVSRRMKEHGLKLVLHDLVGVKGKIDPKEEKPNEDEEDEVDEEGGEEEKVEIIEVTKENIDKYTIFDVVAPLYGPSAEIPKTSIIFQYIQD